MLGPTFEKIGKPQRKGKQTGTLALLVNAFYLRQISFPYQPCNVDRLPSQSMLPLFWIPQKLKWTFALTFPELWHTSTIMASSVHLPNLCFTCDHKKKIFSFRSSATLCKAQLVFWLVLFLVVCTVWMETLIFSLVRELSFAVRILFYRKIVQDNRSVVSFLAFPIVYTILSKMKQKALEKYSEGKRDRERRFWRA